MSESRINLETKGSLSLPAVSDLPPGWLHSIVRDDDGNLYYSDEFNHHIVSVTERGELRWYKGGKGIGPGQFQYPQGMSIGWTQIEEGKLHCLAVCDSWNHRVQIFRLNGDRVGCWESSGLLRFGEVVDIRFIAANLTEGDSQGYWLILDRGNHRLLALDMSGEPLFTVGRCFPTSHEPNLADDFLDPQGDYPSQCIDMVLQRFDCLYYPSRILGETEEALFIWEPGSRTLKQLLVGGLFRLPLELPEDAVCFAANAERILSWRSDSGHIVCHDPLGDWLLTSEAAGRPVGSSFRSNEFWIQNDRQLVQWSLNHVAKARSSMADRPYGLFQRSLESDLERAELDPSLLSAIQGVGDSSEAFITSTRDLLQLSSLDIQDVESLRALQADIPTLHATMRRAIERVGIASGSLISACLKLRILRTVVLQSSNIPVTAEFIKRFELLLKPIHVAFIKLQNQWDDLMLLHYSILPKRASLEGHSLHLFYAFVQQQKEIFTAMRVLQMTFGALQADVPLFALPSHSHIDTDSQKEMLQSGQRLRRPVRAARIQQEHLREIDRVFVGNNKGDTPSSPYGLTTASNGNIYVTLHAQHQILCLSERGDLRRRFPVEDHGDQSLQKPFGIAADENDRLWVVCLYEHAVLIIDAGTGLVLQSLDQGPDCSPLRFPTGICRGSNGAMLLADMGNHRIVAWSKARQPISFCQRIGTGSGELRSPIALSPDGSRPEATVWVADQLNHRVQELDSSGRFVRQIGGCGIGRGRLLLPEFVLPLTEDMLVISQWRFNKELKIFSKRGEELYHMPLDYAPAGLLLHRGMLLVAEYDGDHIRVYERV